MNKSPEIVKKSKIEKHLFVEKPFPKRQVFLAFWFFFLIKRFVHFRQWKGGQHLCESNAFLLFSYEIFDFRFKFSTCFYVKIHFLLTHFYLLHHMAAKHAPKLGRCPNCPRWVASGGEMVWWLARRSRNPRVAGSIPGRCVPRQYGGNRSERFRFCITSALWDVKLQTLTFLVGGFRLISQLGLMRLSNFDGGWVCLIICWISSRLMH